MPPFKLLNNFIQLNSGKHKDVLANIVNDRVAGRKDKGTHERPTTLEKEVFKKPANFVISKEQIVTINDARHRQSSKTNRVAEQQMNYGSPHMTYDLR